MARYELNLRDYYRILRRHVIVIAAVSIGLGGMTLTLSSGTEPSYEARATVRIIQATDLAGFIGRYDDKRDRFWTVAIDDLVAGSLSVDGIHAHTQGAHLRWFIVSEELQGQGIGNQLIRSAIDFCKEKKYPSIYLWTFKGLLSARHLYEKAGFTLVEQCKGCEWGVEVVEQRLVLTL